MYMLHTVAAAEAAETATVVVLVVLGRCCSCCCCCCCFRLSFLYTRMWFPTKHRVLRLDPVPFFYVAVINIARALYVVCRFFYVRLAFYPVHANNQASERARALSRIPNHTKCLFDAPNRSVQPATTTKQTTQQRIKMEVERTSMQEYIYIYSIYL